MMKKKILVLLSILFVSFAYSQITDPAGAPFTIRQQQSIKGDIIFAANQIVNRGSNSNPNTVNTSYTGGGSNAGRNMQYINIERASGSFLNPTLTTAQGNGVTVFSSSSCQLSNPVTSGVSSGCSTITYAGLYWSAVYPQVTWNDTTTPTPDDYDHILFKLPGSSQYTEVTGDKLYFGASGLGAYTKSYVCYRDVTNLIQANSGGAWGEYRVANMKATTGVDPNGFGSAGGWVLVVFYQNSSVPARNVTLYNGYSPVYGTNREIVNFEGFVTVPEGNPLSPSPVYAKALVAALEGDRSIRRDGFFIQNDGDSTTISPTDPTTYNAQSTASNPTNNFFNGSINSNGVPLPGRFPSLSNTLGFDVSSFNIPNANNDVIGNDDDFARMKFETNGDAYFPFLCALSVQVIQPNIEMVKSVIATDGTTIAPSNYLDLGDTFFYDIEFKNTGTDNAVNSVITDILPYNIDLINVVLPTNASSSSDPATYTYEAPTLLNGNRGVLKVSIPDHMVEIDGPEYTLRLQVRVIDDCSKFRNACSNQIENIALASAEGERSGIKVNSESFSTFFNCATDLQRSTNFLADISGCTYNSTVTFCGGQATLNAGTGYDTYTWTNSSGQVVGDSSTITVNTLDTYTVLRQNNASKGCLSNSEVIVLVPISDVPDPVAPYADRVLTCSSNPTLQVSEIYLCGSQNVTINTGWSSPVQVQWQTLRSGFSQSSEDCPVNDNAAWENIIPGTQTYSRQFSDPGNYRLLVEYENGCPDQFYFNVFKGSLNATATVVNSYCENQGHIDILNVPTNYKYAAVDVGSPEPATATFVSANHPTGGGATPTIYRFTPPAGTYAGVYDFYAYSNEVNGCVFKLFNAGIALAQTNLEISLVPQASSCGSTVTGTRVNIDSQITGQFNYVVFNSSNATVATYGPTSARSHDFSLAAQGDQYTIEVTALDHNCSTTASLTLSNGQSPVLTAIKTKDINCSNSDGTIELSVTGGSPTYTIRVDSYAGTGTVALNTTIATISGTETVTYNVADGNEGTYVFRVIDSKNCNSLSDSVTVLKEVDLSFIATPTNVKCIGDDDGAIYVDLEPSLRSLGYDISYNLSGSTTYHPDNGNGFVFTGLSPGSYTINVRAVNGAFTCDRYSIPNLIIGEPSAISATATLIQDFTCTTNGIIEFAVPTGGTEPYFYSINADGVNASSTTYQATRTFTNLSSGVYPLYVKDNFSCAPVFAGSITVSSVDPAPTPDSFTGNATQVSGSCNLFDYTVIPPAGDSTTYLYSVDSSAFTASTTFTNLTVGTHTLSIRTANSCSGATKTFIIVGGDFRGSIVGVENSPCYGANNGKIIIVAEGYTYACDDPNNPGFEYSVDGGSWLLAAADENVNYEITGLEPGTHQIRIRPYGVDCPVSIGTETISEPTAPITIQHSFVADPSCAASGNSIIAVGATGGTSPYEITLNGVTISTPDTAVFTIPAGATYTVTVEDANGCNICGCNENPPINGDFENINPGSIGLPRLQGSELGVVNLSANNFASACNKWYPQNSIPGWKSSAPAGEIEIWTDGCDSAPSIGGAPSNRNFAEINASCNATLYQTICVKPGDQIRWTVDHRARRSVLGIYDQAEVIIGETIANANVVQVMSTDGYGNAHATSSPNNGTKIVVVPLVSGWRRYTGTYTVPASQNSSNIVIGFRATKSSWSPSFNTTGNIKEGNFIDNFSVQVLNSTCNDTEISVPLPATPTFTVDGVASCSDRDVTVTATSGIQPFQFSINGGSFNPPLAGDTNTYTFTGLNPGQTYSITIRDQSGCVSNPATVTIPSLQVFAPNVTPITCNPGVVVINNVSGGDSSTYEYGLLEQGSPGPVVYGATNTFALTDTGTYNAYVRATFTNSNGTTFTCSDSTSFTVSAADVATITNVSITNPTCGNDNGSIEVDISGGQRDFEISLYNGTAQVASITSNSYLGNTLSGLGTGTYTLQIVDANGCTTTDTIIITDTNTLTASITVTNDYACNQDGTVYVSVTGGTETYNYYYVEVDTATGNAIATSTLNTNATFTFTGYGGYEFYVRDGNGCKAFAGSHTFLPIPIIPDHIIGTPTYNCQGSVSSIELIPDTTTTTPDSLTYAIPSLGINATTSNVLTNLPEGIHTVVVNMARACSVTYDLNIQNREPLEGNIVRSIANTCHASDDGSIVIIADNYSGGTIEYSTNNRVNWTSVPLAENTEFAIQGLTDGDHGIWIRKPLNEGDTSTYCEVFLGTGTITEPSTITITTNVIQEVSCNITGNGLASVEISASGGTGPYHFSIDGGVTYSPPLSSPGSTTVVVTDIAVGTYTVTVLDDNGCNSCGCTGNSFVNGGFEELELGGRFPSTTMGAVGNNSTGSGGHNDPLNNYWGRGSSGSAWIYNRQRLVPGWATTEFYGWIEYYAYYRRGANIFNADEGNYYAQLNAHTESALYQSFCTTDGGTMTFSVAHRGSTGVDTAGVFIGATLAEALASPPVLTMVTDNTAWVTYNGTYTIPIGQNTTVIAFEALSGTSPTVGNFLDDVKVNIVREPCDVFQVTEIVSPATVTFVVDTPTCISGNPQVDALTVNVTSGEAPFQYGIQKHDAATITWNTPAPGAPTNTYTFTPLTNGTYTLFVKDNLNCAGDSQTITINPPIVASFNTTPINCNASGTITVDATSTYTYQYAFISSGAVTDADFSDTPTFVSNATGTYGVYIRYQNGYPNCITFLGSATINEVQNATITNTDVVSPTCNGLSNGSIEIDITDGTAPYSILLQEGTPIPNVLVDSQTGVTTLNNIDFTGLSNGTYTISIIDANGCTTTSNPIILTSPDSVVSSITAVQDISCGVLGSVTINTTGGTIPYRYSYIKTEISGATSTIAPVANGGVFSNLTAGTYTFFVEDDNSCPVAVDTQTFEELPVIPRHRRLRIASNCFGSYTSVVATFPSNRGPLPPGTVYELRRNGTTTVVATSTTGVFDNLETLVDGVYRVYATAPRACELYLGGFRTPNPRSVISGRIDSVLDVSCKNAANGQITIRARGYQGNRFLYHVVDDTGASTTWDTAFVGVNQSFPILGLSAGRTYEVFIKEIDGTLDCPGVSLGSRTINGPEQLDVYHKVVEDVSCEDLNNLASVAIWATGGVAPYRFSIDGGATWSTPTYATYTVNDVVNGTYTILVEDSNGCNQCGCTGNPFINGGFETRPTPTSFSNQYRQDIIEGWTTSDSRGRIEFWNEPLNSNYPAFDGDNFVEINANVGDNNMLYQTFCTSGGDTLTWFVAHAGRTGVDVGTVIIGPSVGINSVVATMTDGRANTNGWGTYTGTYTVPMGQTTTIIGFRAVSSANGNTSYGNFIDGVDIQIERSSCAPVVVDVQAPATVTYTRTAIDCSNTGEFTITATQGLAPFFFSKDGGTTWEVPLATSPSNTYTFDNLTVGDSYTIVVKDALDCESDSETITIFAPMRANTEVVDILACNATGAISVINVTGGDSSTYQYAFVNEGTAVTDADYSATPTYIVSATGTYDVYIRYNNGDTNCSSFLASETVNKSELATITDSDIVITNPRCNGEANGSFEFDITNGKAPFAITVTGTTTTTSYSDSTTSVSGNNIEFSSLENGTYTIVVTDADGCTSTKENVIVTEPNTLVATATLNNEIVCNVTTASVTITTSGGNGTNTYRYVRTDSNGDTTTNSQFNNPYFTSLLPGIYEFTVEDSKGCTADAGSATIDRLPVVPSHSASVTYDCDGLGTIVLTKSSSTASNTLTYTTTDTLTYYLDGDTVGTTTMTFTNLTPGLHTISISASRTCATTTSVEIIGGQEFMANITGVDNIVCRGDQGSITITVSNFDTNTGYQYTVDTPTSWSTAIATETFTIGGLVAGTHTISIRPFNSTNASCTLELTRILTEPNATLTITDVTVDSVTCTQNAILTPSVSSVAVGVVTYELFNATGTVATTTTSFTDVLPGTYTVIAVDGNSCISDSYTVFVAEPASLTFTASKDENCYNGDNATITINVTSGNGGYSYAINNGAYQTFSGTNTSFNVGVGTYTISVIDRFGCSNATQTIRVSDELLVDATVTDISCIDGSITINPIGGDGNYRYYIESSSTGTPTLASTTVFVPTNTFNVSSTGTYYLFVRDHNATGTDICEKVISREVDTVINPTITLTVTDTVCYGDLSVINVGIANGLAPYQLEITNATGTAIQPSQTINNLSSPIYFTNISPNASYTVTLIDANGCSDSQTIYPFGYPNLELDIVGALPNACKDFTIDNSGFGYSYIIPDTLTSAPYQVQVWDELNDSWVNHTQGTLTIAGTAPDTSGLTPGTFVTPRIRLLNTNTNQAICTKTLNDFEIPFIVEGLIVNPIVDPATCNAGFSVTVEAQEGVGPFSFAVNSTTTWVSADTYTVGTSTTPIIVSPTQTIVATRTYTFNNLIPGVDYDFYVKDASGCIKKNNEGLYEDFIPDVAVEATITSIACNGSDTGSIQYTIEPSTNTYTLTYPIVYYIYDTQPVFDTNTNTFNIPSPPLKNGTITAADPDSKTFFIDGLGVGEYYAVTYEANGTGCQWGSNEVRIARADTITATLDVLNATVTCSNAGQILIRSINGGVAPYTFAATVTQNSMATSAVVDTNTKMIYVPYSILSDTSAITVDVTIFDSNGDSITSCNASLSTILQTVERPQIDTITVNSCESNKTVTVDLENQGTPPYTYYIDGGSISKSSPATTSLTYTFDQITANGNTPVEYIVEVRDQSNCVADTQSITIYPNIEFAVTPLNNISCVPSEGLINIEVTRGSSLTTTGSFTYTVSGPTTNGNGSITGVATADTYTVTEVGTHTIVIIDNLSGCLATRTIVIADAPTPSFTATATTGSICYASDKGQIKITPDSFAIGTVTYAINSVGNGSNTAVFDTPTLVFTNLVADTYTITATGVNGCTATQQVVIAENDSITLTSASVTVVQFGCNASESTTEAKVQVSAMDILGGTNNYSTLLFEYGSDSQTVTAASGVFEYTTFDTTGGTVAITVYDDSPLNCASTPTLVYIDPYNEIATATISIIKSVDCSTTNASATLALEFGSTIPTDPINASITIVGQVSDTITTSGTSTVNVTGLSPDTYTITIINPNTGCGIVRYISIPDKIDYIVDVLTTVDASCINSGTGEVSFNFNPVYSGSYTYRIVDSNTSTEVASDTISDGTTLVTVDSLTVSEYIINAYLDDGSNCVASNTFVINNPAATLTVTGTPTAPSCIGSTDGEIRVAASGGWPAYDYILVDATNATQASSPTDSALFEGLSVGTYTVYAVDSKGCANASDTIYLSNPDSITIVSVVKDDFACDNTTNASVTITASGGTGSLTYVLVNNSATYTNNTGVFSLPIAGTYTINVIDDNGCELTSPLNSTLTISPKLDDIFSINKIKNLDCTVNTDASVEVIVSAPNVSDYEYRVDLDTGTVSVFVATTTVTNSTFTFNPNTSGTYTVSLIDLNASGCNTDEKSIYIAPSIQPSFTVAVQSSICYSSSDGLIDIEEIKNNVHPLDYSITSVAGGATGAVWDSATLVYSNLIADTYTITAVGTNDCVASMTVVITQNDTISLTTASMTATDFACTSGNTPNTVRVFLDSSTITGGSGNYNSVRFEFNSNPYLSGTTTVSDTIVQNSDRFEFLLTNTYGGTVSVTVSDGNLGCNSPVARELYIAPLNELSSPTINLVRPVDCTGNATLEVGFDSSLASDSINASVTFTNIVTNASVTFSGTSTVTALVSPGSYTVVIRNPETGCELPSEFIEVLDVEPRRLVVIQTDNVSCTGTASGSVKFDFDSSTPYGGTFTYTVQGSSTVMGTVTAGSNTEVTIENQLLPSDYTIEVQLLDGSGCIATSTFTISNPTSTLTVTGTPTLPTCIGSGDGKIRVGASGGWPTYDYILVDATNATQASSPSDPSLFEGLQAGTYTVYAIDSKGCANASDTIILNDPASITIVALDKNDNICNSQLASISVTVSGGTPTYRFDLINIATSASTSITSSTNTGVFTNVAPGDYRIDVIDANGCRLDVNSTNASLTIIPELRFGDITIDKNIDCTTNTNGSVTVNIASGSGNYEYLVQLDTGTISYVASATVSSASSGVATASFEFPTALPGTYVIAITDLNASGSCNTIETNIGIAPRILPTFTITAVSDTICYGSNDGVINISETNNGVNPLVYSISSVGTGSTVAVFDTTTLRYTNLVADTYTIRAVGTNDCEATTTVVITQYDSITFTNASTITVTEFGCNADRNPDFTIITVDSSTITGGRGTYKARFVFDNGTPSDDADDITEENTSFEFRLSKSSIPLQGGTVTVSVFDVDTNGNLVCSSEVVRELFIEPFNEIENATVAVTQVINCSDTTATVDVAIFTTIASQTINASVTLTEVTTGASTTVSGTSTVTVENVAVGTYTIAVVNPITGCQVTRQLRIDPQQPFNLKINNVNDVVCKDSATGSVEFAFQDTTPYAGTFTYVIATSTTTPPVLTGTVTGGNTPVTVDSLTASDYVVTIFMLDSPYCSASTTFVVASPTDYLAATAIGISPRCIGGNTGRVIAGAAGGWPSYEYMLLDVSGTDMRNGYESNTEFTGLTAGTYTLYVRDSKGCANATVSVTLTDPDSMTITSLVKDNTSCDTSIGGSVTVTISGGTPTYDVKLVDSNNSANSWSPQVQGTNTATFTDIPPGDYAVTVIDAYGCPLTSNVNSTVTFTGDVLFNPIETQKLSCSSPNGLVTVSIYSGSGNYQFNVQRANGTNVPIVASTTATNGIGTFTFNTDTPTIYAVTVIDLDSGGCSVVDSITIAPAIQPTFTTTLEKLSVCSGETSGVITVATTNNGSEPVVYTLNSVNGGHLAAVPDTSFAGVTKFTNLSGDTYTITGTASNGCVATQSVVIIQNPPIDLTLAVSAVQFACAASNSVAVARVVVDPANITGGNGTGSYNTVKFEFDALNPADDDTVQGTNFEYGITSKGGGTVTVTVIDSGGCEGTTVAYIQPFNEISSPTATVIKEVDCRALPVGGATLQVDFTSTYAPITNANITVTGDDTGMTFTATSTASGVTFTGLPADFYTIDIVNPDNGGCITTTYQNVYDVISYELIATKVNDVTCFESNTGSVEFGFRENTPFTGAYTYEVMVTGGSSTGITGSVTAVTGTISATTIISSLPANATGTSYYIIARMTDSPYCQAQSNEFTIVSPPSALLPQLDLELISCIRDDAGRVVMSATGGWQGGYTYQLTNAITGDIIQPYNNNNVIQGLTAGTYTASIRDGVGCATDTMFVLEAPEPIIATATEINLVQCTGDRNAAIRIDVTGGQGDPVNYFYALTYPNGVQGVRQATNTFTELAAGTYTVTVYDEYKCFGETSFIINEPTKVKATAVADGRITCLVNTVDIVVQGEGGTGTYTYSIDGVNFQPSNSFSVGAGVHELYVKDANDCISLPYFVTVPDLQPLEIKMDTSYAIVTCYGQSNAVISVDAKGALGDYRYELLESGNVVQGPQEDNMFFGLGPGTYSVRVTSFDCSAVSTNTFTITQPDELVASTTITDVSCNGLSDGSIVVEPSGGNGDYLYSIDTEPRKYQDVNTFENLQVGTYTVTVLDKIGCPVSVEVYIDQPEPLEITLDGEVNQQLCSDDALSSFSATITGGTPPYFTSINGDDFTEGRVDFTDLEGGETYYIFVRDSKGCSAKVPLEIYIDEPVNLEFEAKVTYDCNQDAFIIGTVADEHKNDVVYTLTGPDSQVNETGVFTVYATGEYTLEVEHSNGCVKVRKELEVVEIEPLIMLVDKSQKNKLIAEIEGGVEPYEVSVDGVPIDGNVYTILRTKDYLITVKDARGCEIEKTVRGEYVTLKIPNFFTPNGDGKNDYWYPYDIEEYHNLRVSIFDRYHRLIARYKGLELGWDGLYKTKPLPTGDYWYTIHYNELSGEKKELMGHFTLYRKQ